LLSEERYELLGIHDAKSLCEGYNRGVRAARGDVVIFSHDDIEILEPDFARRLALHAAHHDLIGLCGTTRLTDGFWMNAGWPHLRGLVAHHYPDTGHYRVLVLDGECEASRGVQALDGLFLAARRELLDRVRFDEETFDGFHLYDLDFSFRAHRQGYDVAVCHDIPVVHYTYAEAAGYREAYGKYLARFERKHAAHFTPVARGNTRFLQALFPDKQQVRMFCAALLAERRRLALEPPQALRA
jgi:GT2 family glycosyltransferase